MWAKLLIFASLFLLFGKQPDNKNKYQKEYYEKGHIKAEGWISDGIRSQYWKFYDQSGKISMEGHYKNGIKSDFWKFYGINGHLAMQGRYNNGAKTQWWEFYDKYGAIILKCQYKDGIKNGYCLKYQNEKLKSAVKYVNGKERNEWFSYLDFTRDNNLSDLQ